MFKSRLSVKISLRLAVIAAPLMVLATWIAVIDARETATEMLLDQGRVAALAGAQASSSIIESGINAGQLSLSDVLEPNYEEIQFPGIVVESKRYHTKLGDYTDTHGIQVIEDQILGSSPNFAFSSMIDRRGYVPTPHHKFDNPPTGNVKLDRAVSRGKRMYDDTEQIAAAGYRGNAGKPTLVQDYHRDTGDLIWDVAAPITIKGHHFGAFRVGVVKDRVHAETVSLAWLLGRTLGSAIFLLVAAVLISTQRVLRPLVELACLATRLSTAEDGVEFEKKIRVESTDEVGQMARALELIRGGLRAAWSRLRLLDDAIVGLGLRVPVRGDSAEAARRRCAEAEAGTLRREVP